MKKKGTSITIPPDLIDNVKKLADSDSRSFSAMVAVLLGEAIATRQNNVNQSVHQ